MSTEQNAATLEVTQVASEKIQEFLQSEGKGNDHALRIRVKPGGCSGFEYVLELDQARDSDNAFGAETGRVIIDEISMPYLNGSVIDYVESIHGAGFDIRNPNTTGSCGCGSSVGF